MTWIMYNFISLNTSNSFLHGNKSAFVDFSRPPKALSVGIYMMRIWTKSLNCQNIIGIEWQESVKISKILLHLATHNVLSKVGNIFSDACNHIGRDVGILLHI